MYIDKEKKRLYQYIKKGGENMKKTKKLYLKKWLEKLLITINTCIFCFICCIDDFTSIKAYLLLMITLFTIFYINYRIIKKYGRLLKDDEE